MKKVIYLFALVAAVLTGCNPLEDINAEVDAIPDEPNVGAFEYTLIDADYERFDLGFGSFGSDQQVKDSIPLLLNDLYPLYGEGSSALVNYNLFIGEAFDIRNFDLDQDDYTFSGSDGLGFNSNANPENFLADILADNVDSPSIGDYRLAKYFQFTGDFIIVTPTVSLDENFDYDVTTGDLTAVSGGAWEAHSGEGDGPIGYVPTSLTMTDYPSSDIGGSITVDGDSSEDVSNYFSEISEGTVYASTLVNLSAVNSGTYTFHLRDDDFAVGYVARVGAKDDGSGKIVFGIGASSSSLEYGSTPFDLNTTYLLVSSYNIETGQSNLYVLSTAEATEPTDPETTSTGESGAIVSGVSIRQGFGGPTGVFDGVRIANTWSAIMTNDTLTDETIGDKTAGEMFFEYTENGWETPSSRFYSITDEDFASMGLTSFGSSNQADNYLPAFLALKYPFAQEDDTLDIAYTYNSSSSGLSTRGDVYTYTNGVWVRSESTIESSLQFGFSDGEWVPDNTVRYMIAQSDFDYIEANYAATVGFEAAVSSMANFGNFDRRPSNAAYWSDEMVLTVFADLLDTTIATGAEDGQKYVVSVAIYDGSNGIEEFSLIKTADEWIYNVE